MLCQLLPLHLLTTPPPIGRLPLQQNLHIHDICTPTLLDVIHERSGLGLLLDYVRDVRVLFHETVEFLRASLGRPIIIIIIYVLIQVGSGGLQIVGEITVK